MLRDKTRFSHEELAAAQDPFAGHERGLRLSSIFVDFFDADYGTRTSSVLLLGADSRVVLEERTFSDRHGLEFSAVRHEVTL